MAYGVFGIASHESQAVAIAEELRMAGFTGDDVSVLFPDRAGSKDFAHEQHTKAPEGAATGAGAGGILGATLGWLVGVGSLAIPGLGAFVAAGPIMAALSGAGAGAAVGGVAGALVGIGIPEYEAKLYEGKIGSGNILMSVHATSADKRDVAVGIFERCGASDVAVSTTTAPARQPTINWQ